MTTERNKLNNLALTLKNHGYRLYTDEMELRRAMGKHDAVLVELKRRTSETMFDLYESETVLKVIAPSRMYGEIPHYCSLQVFPDNDHHGNPAIGFYQENAGIYAHYGINDFLSAIRHNNAQTIEEGKKVIVFAYTDDGYFGFEGYVGRPSYYCSDICDLLPRPKKA